MKHTYSQSLMQVLFIAALILSSNAIYAQGKGMSTSQNHSENEIWFNQPASTWLQALPLGNGTMGAMVYGQTDKEKIQFNENSLVTGTTDMVGFYQPFGNIIFDFGHENASGYKRSLLLGDAMHTISYQHQSTHFKREYFVSQPDQALIMMITADKKSAVNMAIALKDTRASQTDVTSNSISFRGKLQENGMEYMAKLIVNTKGGKRINTDSSIVVLNADTVLVYMSAITSFKKFNVRDVFGALPVELLNARLGAVSKQSYKVLRARHTNDFSKLFNRVKLNLGPDVSLPTDQRLLAYNNTKKDNGMEALLFQYGRYLLISSSRKGGLPANLQGLWNNEVKPAWYSQYTTNINIQMNYWSAEVTNISETHLPMLDWVENLGRVQKTSTDSVLKTKSGWVAYSTNNIMGGPSRWRLHRPGSAWMSQHFWEHYAFTLDTVFLRDRAYPLLKELVEYWEGHLVVGKNGKLITPDGWSPEHGPGKNEGDKNPYPGASYDQQIIDELFTNYISAAKVLGKDVAYRMKVESMQKQLLKGQIGRWGQLQEWMEDWDDSTDHHRHYSHMFAVHPGKQIDPIHTPELSAAARRSLEARGAISTGWSSAWKINIWARLFDGDNAHVMVRGLLKPVNTGSKSGEKGGINPNLFGSYPPFQMDANFGFTAGIAEMLLQSQNDIIHLLPALPTAWSEGEVSGLKARGNVLVDMKWSAGKLTQVKLKSRYNGNYNLLYKGKQLMLKMIAGKTYALDGGFFKTTVDAQSTKPASISGIYPSLAMYNQEGECGTGAVVPWAGKLWAISYGPHLPFGSSDKLYEISSNMQQTIRPESVGGTPANRMIHRESNQLFIGHYAIDAKGNVRVIPITEMPGRLTGIARSITDPANKLVFATMEEGFYEVDVHSLTVKLLFKDGNVMRREGAKSHESELLQGVHGKGFYSGQGVYVYSNNGEAGEKARVDPKIEAGSLSEWDGKTWKLIRRNQFVEVTGPGGIEGNPNPATDPIWSTGWDYKSVIIACRDNGKWSFYRLPKASNSYDGAHGWNTEWPRIRNVGTEQNKDFMMTMHGMFWRFPASFKSSNTAGIRPRSSYLKVIGDFTRWNNQLVFGCDDAAKSEFLNKRKEKGGILGPGQSNSNLWFTSLKTPDSLGSTGAQGSVWYNEQVQAGAISEPFLFAGWDKRSALLKNHSNASVSLVLEVDKLGNGKWQLLQQLNLSAGASVVVPFAKETQGEWIRVKSLQSSSLSASFVYGNNKNQLREPAAMFNGLSKAADQNSLGGLLLSLGDEKRKLGILANAKDGNVSIESGYYEMDSAMNIVLKNDLTSAAMIRDKVAIPSQVVQVEPSSILLVDGAGRRWRLPHGGGAYKGLMERQSLRICREVATERDLFNCAGTFYELPSENADGFAKMRPIATHGLHINDYASFRGMLIMTGIDPKALGNNKNIFTSADKKAAIWAGVIDDLWKMGKLVGQGGPWLNTPASAGVASDPYLFGGYDARSVQLSHQNAAAVQFTLQLDATGDGVWYDYKTITVPAGKTISHVFPAALQSKWIRVVANKDANVTAQFRYK